MKESGFLKLNLRDFIKGALMAILTPVLFAVQQSLDAGVLTLEWKKLGMIALGAFVGYLIKNWLQKPEKKNEETSDSNSGS
jgi:hypothetical protein